VIAFHSSKEETQVQCGALLFDLDGVLIDSTPAVARVWKGWALERGLDPVEVVARAHGRPSLTTVREYLPHADYAAENREVERREIEDIEGVIPLPGAVELLGQLPEECWTIVTSCTRRLAEVRLRAAGLPIPRQMITSTDVVQGKPHPEPYLKGAVVLGFSPKDCIVVEDAPAGVQSGKAAGARVIGFTTTMAALVVSGAGADWIVGNCADIGAASSGTELMLSLRGRHGIISDRAENSDS
jgi:mannitol-1-/sugar-/sorbitol-6-phosphatase